MGGNPNAELDKVLVRNYTSKARYMVYACSERQHCHPHEKHSILISEGLELVFRLVFKTSSGRITPSVAGSIPALSVFLLLTLTEW